MSRLGAVLGYIPNRVHIDMLFQCIRQRGNDAVGQIPTIRSYQAQMAAGQLGKASSGQRAYQFGQTECGK